MSAVTKYGIELEVALGIGRAAEVGAWDVSKFDADRWGQEDTELGDWVDVTCDVSDPLTLAAGASDIDGIVTRWEAATCSFTLYGTQYDPWTGPWSGLLGALTPVRVRWRQVGAVAWFVAFTGAMTLDGWSWDPASKPPRANVTASDSTQVLVAWDGLAQPVQGQGESASARVRRILDSARWPQVLREITDGGVAVQDTTLSESAWTMLLQVADTDLALLWIRRDGRLAYIPQGRVGLGTQLQARLVACREQADDIEVVTMTRAQAASIRNVVSVSRQKRNDDDEPYTVNVEDDRSIARYLGHAYQRTDLIHDDDEWSHTLAEAILASSAWPSDAPEQVTLDSRTRDARVPPLLLSLEPSYSFDVVAPGGSRSWREACAGWDVSVGREAISGVVKLTDVSRWVAGRWDSAGWDVDRWGVDYTTAYDPALFDAGLWDTDLYGIAS